VACRRGPGVTDPGWTPDDTTPRDQVAALLHAVDVALHAVDNRNRPELAAFATIGALFASSDLLYWVETILYQVIGHSERSSPPDRSNNSSRPA
jgi:hypothetical protein